MPKISEILEKYSISRETLANSYKLVIGKSLPAKTVNLKDEERSLIEPTFSLAHIGKPKKNDGKVFKAEEVAFGDDFLSGLGFGPKDDEKVEEEEVDVFAKEEEAPVVEKPVKPSFGNAVVIESAPPRPARTSHKAPFKKDDKKDSTASGANTPAHERTKSESESRGKTFYKFSPNTPSFSK